MKRLGLCFLAMLVLTCFAWFALYEVYYDGEPPPQMKAQPSVFCVAR